MQKEKAIWTKQMTEERLFWFSATAMKKKKKKKLEELGERTRKNRKKKIATREK